MKKYKINEIFYSIQGEGFWTGTPMTFVRFSGCNLKCKFCDTAHESNTEMTVDDILQEVYRNPTHYVCLTGGEPMLQIDEYFMEVMSSTNKYFHLETNGTILPEKDFMLRRFNWITVSPKTRIKEDWYRYYANELKVIYQGKDVNKYIDRVSDDVKLYLQPCSMKNIKETIKYVKENSRWNLSIQTQKLLSIK